jgi:catechol 2,3-dioxygenase-like lactoylglutathione lyase family enzyme
VTATSTVRLRAEQIRGLIKGFGEPTDEEDLALAVDHQGAGDGASALPSRYEPANIARIARSQEPSGPVGPPAGSSARVAVPQQEQVSRWRRYSSTSGRTGGISATYCRSGVYGPEQERFAVPSVHGILETALYVKDVQKAAALYRRLFGFATLLDSERLIALDVAGRNVLLLFKEGATKEPFATSGGVIPGHAGSGVTHFAFSIASEDLADWQQRLVTEGVAIESVVNWPGGAQSIYFRDDDTHLVELITPGFWRIGGS